MLPVRLPRFSRTPMFSRDLISIPMKLLKALRYKAIAVLMAAAPLKELHSVERPAAPVEKLEGRSIDLTHWIVAGPFWQNDGDIWENSFVDERSASNGDLASVLGRIGVGSANSSDDARAAKSYLLTDAKFVDFVGLFGLPYNTSSPSAAYAGCIIHSDLDAVAYLLLGSADGVRLWLNGERVYENSTRRGVSTYDDAVKLSLRAGANTLLVKVCRWRIPWGLTARLEISAISAAETALSRQGMLQSLLLKSAMIQPGGTLEIYPRGVPMDAPLEWTIYRSEDIVDRLSGPSNLHRWSPRIPLESGLYKIACSINDQRFTETFCVGDPQKIGADLFERARYLQRDRRKEIAIDAMRMRYDILFDPKNKMFKSEGERYAWERKVLWIFDELASLTGNKRFPAASGLHLRAFRSNIDGAVQHYRIFIPELRDKHKSSIPMVVLLPTAISANRAFIESAFMASHSEAERMAAIAQRYGVGLVWSGYRNRPDGSPCEMAHLDEVLRDVEMDYPLDETRITLLGTCSGGAMATSIASNWPERFAGVALLNPMFSLNKYLSEQTAASFSSFASFRKWMQSGDSVAVFMSEKPCPIYIIHDGAEPGHGDLTESVKFWEKGMQLGCPVLFERKIQTLAQHFGAWEDLVRWLSAQKRSNPSSRPGTLFERTQQRDNRVAEAFEHPFVVVQGTLGSPSTCVAIEKMVKDFSTSWRTTHYGECRIVYDWEFKASNYENHNLVLVGSEESNTVWRSFLPAIDLRIGDSSVKLGNRSWQGRALSFISSVRRPDAPNRKLVLIGSQKPENAKFGTLRLSTEGWFSYAIWDNEGGVLKTLAADVL
jgi:pimeloyl-ACP methyl ester carboxylesterase